MHDNATVVPFVRSIMAFGMGLRPVAAGEPDRPASRQPGCCARRGMIEALR